MHYISITFAACGRDAMAKDRDVVRKNLRLARLAWGGRLTENSAGVLREYSERFGLSIATGDLLLLDGRWYVSHSGLVGLAAPKRVLGNSSSASPRILRAAIGSMGV